MKHLFTLVFLSCSLFSTLLEAQDITFNNTVAPEIYICDDSENFTVRFTNSTADTIANVSIRVDLPTGITYEDGFAETSSFGVTLSSQGSGYVLFTCDSIPSLGEVNFNFSLAAGFSAISFQNSGGVFRNTVSVNYNGGSSESDETDAYNILYPALSITNVTEMSQSAYAGETFTRTVTIANGGFGRLESFVLHDIHNANLTVLSTDVGTLSATEDSIVISTADIQGVGDGDTYFEQNETITITQTIKAVGCSSSQTRLYATWGCDGAFEESNNRYPYTTVQLYTPDLDVTVSSPFNTCVDGTADQQSLTIVNNGNGPALGVELDVSQLETYQFSRIDVASISYTVDGGSAIPLTPNTTTDTYDEGVYDCLGSGAKGGFVATLPDILPDETIVVSWGRYVCATDYCGDVHLIGWEYDIDYDDACQSSNFSSSGTGQDLKDKNFSLFTENPSDLSDGQEGTYKYILTSASFDLPEGTNPYFEVVFDIPDGLDYSGDSTDLTYKSGVQEWTPSSVTYDGSAKTLTAEYPLPIALSNLTRSEFTLKLTANCAAGGDGVKLVGMQFNYVMDSSCPSPYRIPLACYVSAETYLHCPGACTHGMAFQSFSAERVSFGSPDNDLDGLPDASGSLDMNFVKANRVMVGDTFQTTFTGLVKTSGTFPDWEYGYATSSVPYGDYLTLIGASIMVVDASTGDTLTCDGVGYSSVVGSGTMSASFDYSISTLTSNGCNTFSGFTYEDGDQVYLMPQYRVTSNPGGIVEQINITNSFYLSDIANPVGSGDKYQCDVWAGNITIIGYFFTSWQDSNVNVHGCSKTVSQNFYLSIGNCCTNYAGGDLFPYEYRHWAILKTASAFVPSGYTVSDPYVDYYRTRYTNSSVKETQSITPFFTNNNSYYFDLSTYLVENGGNLNRSDDGFYGTLYLTLTPECGRPQEQLEDLDWNFVFEEEEILMGGGLTPSYEGTDRLRYRRGDLQVSTNLQTADGLLPTVTWDITVKNNSSRVHAPNSFLPFASPSGNMTVIKVEDISSGDTLVNSGGIFQLGQINKNKSDSYRVYATYDQCETDELVVYTGYDCNGYPADFASVQCEYNDFSLYVNPQPAGVQTRITGSTIGDPCGPLVSVDMTVLSSKLGTVKELFVEIDIPETESILLYPNTVEKRYPVSGEYDTLPNPLLTGGFYQMTDVFIDSIIATDGLVGITDISMNTFNLRFTLEMQDHFQPGEVVEIRVGALRQCGDSIQTIRLNYDPSAVFGRSTDVGIDDEDDSWGAAWADYDSDGDPDLFVTTYDETIPNRLYNNNGDGTFTKETTGSIVTDLASSIGATWGDYDNDGDLDLFVTNNIGYNNFLYRNNGDGSFIAVQNDPVVNYNGYSHGASWADYDNDGYLDLFVAEFFGTRFNLLYHNNGDGTFTRVNDNVISTAVASSVSGVWGDYNNDGLVDLFVANTNDEANFLYKNLGNGDFEEVGTTVFGGALAKSVGGSWGDYDNDGDLDLFVSNSGGQNNNLYQNNGDGTFTSNSGSILATGGGNSHGSAWGDMDNDGDLDLAVANDQNENNFLYSNNGDGTFSVIDNEITNDGGNSFGLAWADFDVDGDIDLFIANHDDEENFLYENERGNCQNYSCMTLVGSNTNASAIGTKIELYANSEWQTRYVSGQTGGGISGQSEMKQIIGVGDASTIDSMVITWPSGYIQTMGPQAVDTCVVYTEPEGAEVCGVVYHDANNNCTFDQGETLIPNVPIYINPGNITVLTDENGSYTVALPVDNYTLQQGSIKNWDKSCNLPDHEISVNVLSPNGQYCGNDFAVTPGCVLPDVGMEIASTEQRVGFSGYFTLNYQNSGTSTADSVALKVDFGNYITPVEASIPWDTVIGTSYIWEMDSLNVGESGSIYIENFLSVEATIGDETPISGNMTLKGADCDTTDNEVNQMLLMQGAIDPNDIAVDPEGPIDPDQVLTYKIRFQNVGNFPVKHVRVEDQLPEELDVSTLEMGAVSHPYKLRIEDHKLIWSFDNINLPDSIRDEVNSHGFIIFRIQPIEGLENGDSFENSANIYFDSQDPIRTNSVENEIFEYLVDADPGQLAVYPNPMRDFTTIEIVSDNLDDQRVMIREILVADMVGKPVIQQTGLDQANIQITADQLSRGYYFIRIRGEDGRTYTGKMLKH